MSREVVMPALDSWTAGMYEELRLDEERCRPSGVELVAYGGGE